MAKHRKAARAPARAAVIYTRVSSRGQLAGVSLPTQLARAKARAKSTHLAILACESDPARSGRTMARRPGLERAIAAACEARGVLLVYSVSRVGRSVRDLYQISERLREHGADLVSVTEPIDTTSPMGKAFFGILAVLAELESDLIGERVRASLEYCRQQRKRWWGKHAPYGWALSHGNVVQVPAEQAVIRKMRAWRRLGWSFGDIANHLTQQKVPTKRRTRIWQRMTVYRILRNDERLLREKRKG